MVVELREVCSVVSRYTHQAVVLQWYSSDVAFTLQLCAYLVMFSSKHTDRYFSRSRKTRTRKTYVNMVPKLSKGVWETLFLVTEGL